LWLDPRLAAELRGSRGSVSTGTALADLGRAGSLGRLRARTLDGDAQPEWQRLPLRRGACACAAPPPLAGGRAPRTDGSPARGRPG
jgi:hypothetical protein